MGMTDQKNCLFKLQFGFLQRSHIQYIKESQSIRKGMKCDRLLFIFEPYARLGGSQGCIAYAVLRMIQRAVPMHKSLDFPGRMKVKDNYTAVVKKSGKWWIGWIAEIPGVNCQESTREELLESLRVTLAEALEFNRREAKEAAGGVYEEERIAL